MLKASTVELVEAINARQCPGKNISVATDTGATAEYVVLFKSQLLANSMVNTFL
jgi:hypothetical protein